MDLFQNRSIDAPIHVVVRDEQPFLINYNRKTYYVEQVLERWKDQQRGHKEEREFFCVTTAEGLLEIYRRGARWYLTGILEPGKGSDALLGSAREREQKQYRIRRLYVRPPDQER